MKLAVNIEIICTLCDKTRIFLSSFEVSFMFCIRYLVQYFQIFRRVKTGHFLRILPQSEVVFDNNKNCAKWRKSANIYMLQIIFLCFFMFGWRTQKLKNCTFFWISAHCVVNVFFKFCILKPPFQNTLMIPQAFFIATYFL